MICLLYWKAHDLCAPYSHSIFCWCRYMYITMYIIHTIMNSYITIHQITPPKPIACIAYTAFNLSIMRTSEMTSNVARLTSSMLGARAPAKQHPPLTTGNPWEVLAKSSLAFHAWIIKEAAMFHRKNTMNNASKYLWVFKSQNIQKISSKFFRATPNQRSRCNINTAPDMDRIIELSADTVDGLHLSGETKWSHCFHC